MGSESIFRGLESMTLSFKEKIDSDPIYLRALFYLRSRRF
jgi:hypothetical protein